VQDSVQQMGREAENTSLVDCECKVYRRRNSALRPGMTLPAAGLTAPRELCRPDERAGFSHGILNAARLGLLRQWFLQNAAVIPRGVN
jgi:hypothetical protein